MTTTALGRQTTSACNGVTTAFAVPWTFKPDSALKVYLLDAIDAANEDGELLVEGDDYTISGDGEAGTASITTLVAHPNGKFIRRWRQSSRAQSADYVADDGFPAESHEDQLDRLSRVDEELDDDIAAVAADVAEVAEDVDELDDRVTDLEEDIDLETLSFSFVVSTLAPGAEATAEISGTFPSFTIALGLPRGNDGSGANLGDGDYGGILVSGSGLTMVVKDGHVTLAKMAALAANSIIGNNTGSAATPIALTAAQVKTLLSLVKGDVGLGNVDNTSDANKPVSTAAATALAGKAPVRPTIATVSDSFTAADADNNSHIVASGASKTLTLGNITAGTAFTVRFTTAWSIACAGGLSKNGAAPGGVTTGSIAANSLITFLHEGAGVWVATGTGLT